MTSFLPSLASRDADGAERRADPRKPLRANAELLIGGEHIAVRTLDISTSGIGISTSVNPRSGQTVSLLLAPSATPRGRNFVTVPVTVVHSVLSRGEGGFKVGLRFAELPPAALAAIRGYLLG
ncbi:MAG: PilZ domain-containing protein [Caldimonas sp.]